MVLVRGSGLTLRLVGLSEYVHPGDCVTVTLRPATVIAPLLSGPSVGATRNATTPLPVPVPPFVRVIQGAPLSAVHAQPAGAVTATWRSPPDGPMLNVSAS